MTHSAVTPAADAKKMVRSGTRIPRTGGGPFPPASTW